MGLSGISFTELLLVLLVLLLLFGSKKLPTIASDLGTAIRGFRRAFSNTRDDPNAEPPTTPPTTPQEPDQAKTGQAR